MKYMKVCQPNQSMGFRSKCRRANKTKTGVTVELFYSISNRNGKSLSSLQLPKKDNQTTATIVQLKKAISQFKKSTSNSNSINLISNQKLSPSNLLFNLINRFLMTQISIRKCKLCWICNSNISIFNKFSLDQSPNPCCSL
jgi:hypothetical protein